MLDFSIIIQARNGSSRLPKKMVKDFYAGRSILQILIERFKHSLNVPVWVATTTSSKDDELVETIQKYDVNIFRGSEENVFSRFIEIIKKQRSQYIIRICGDNPFLNVAYLEQLIKVAEGYDYTSFYDEEIPAIKTHYGIFAEAIRSQCLLNYAEKNITNLVMEHVTPFLYNKEFNYSLKKIQIPDELRMVDSLRLTVDTEEDFKVAQQLYAQHASEDGLNYNLPSLLKSIMQNEEIQNKMIHQIQRNSK